jgi:hypothetical protein
MGKLIETLLTQNKDSYIYQIWSRCVQYLNKDITFLVKEAFDGHLVFQHTHNFHIKLPSDLESWECRDVNCHLKLQPRLKPETSYIFLMKVKQQGISMEFQTDVAQSIPVDDVLLELGLPDCIQRFRDAKIDHVSFLLLTEQHLAEMNVPIGQRVKIMARIGELKRGLFSPLQLLTN